MSPFKLALITGATSGIGRELASMFADKGIPLLLTGRNVEALHKAKADLEQKVPVEIFACDLASPKERAHLVELVRTRTPDLMINNAGFGTYGRILAYDLSTQMNILEVMCSAVLELTYEAAKTLIQGKKKGIIVNVSSTAGFLAMPFFANYAACKAYSKSLSLALDYEFKTQGVRVLCSCPGVVKTGFRKTASGGEEKHVASYFEMDVAYAARRIWDQIEQEKPLDVFDWKYRVMLAFMKLVPQSLLNKMIASSMKKITPDDKLRDNSKF